MTITKPAKTHTFVPTTVAKSSEVNTNFDNAFAVYDTTGYLYSGWFALAGASLEYNSSKSLKTTADVDLTGVIREGDKITIEQSTGGTKYFWISVVDYNSTVANRTYIELISNDTVANQAIVANSTGFSRIAQPLGFPVDPTWGQITAKTSSNTQNTPTQNVWYNLGGSISLPKGRWLLEYNTNVEITRGTISATTTYILDIRFGLSTTSSGDPSSFANGIYFQRLFNDIRFSTSTITRNIIQSSYFVSAYYTATSAVTIYLNASTSRTDADSMALGNITSSFITATPAYR